MITASRVVVTGGRPVVSGCPVSVSPSFVAVVRAGARVAGQAAKGPMRWRISGS
ncbi:hypothetical protein ACFPM0_20735 [Pseudonocardia sulfidoxydans]|uniref:hypothetical protein n=1 Tax=Pseudonocardia sulfidoxydans TaxID=54011 RepID=UPI003616FC56